LGEKGLFNTSKKIDLMDGRITGNIRNKKHSCVKNHCKTCGWEGCYCEMIIDDRKTKDGISTLMCPNCKDRNITFVKFDDNNPKIRKEEY
jgi:hypothetical protein